MGVRGTREDFADLLHLDPYWGARSLGGDTCNRLLSREHRHRLSSEQSRNKSLTDSRNSASRRRGRDVLWIPCQDRPIRSTHLVAFSIRRSSYTHQRPSRVGVYG